MGATLLIMAVCGFPLRRATSRWTVSGPNGEILMEYSIYDAIRAGFDKVVLSSSRA